MGLYEQVDYDFSGPLQPQDLFGREYVTMGGVIDHHLTTTVQSHIKMPKKPVVTTNNGLFPVLAANVQNQQNPRFNVGLYHPVVVLRQLRCGRFQAHFCSIQRDLHLQKRGGQR